jgi:hypothetical protein
MATDLNQLGWIAVQIHHVAGLFSGHCAGVHRNSHIRLSQRGRVVGAIARHRYQAAFALLPFDVLELVGGRRLGEKIVDPGFACNGSGGQRIVARNHHRSDSHGAQLADSLLHAAFHDVFQMNDS